MFYTTTLNRLICLFYFGTCFFSSIKEIDSKGMSNIYFKVTILTFSKFRFSKFKKVCLQVRFLRIPTHADIIEFSNFCCNLKIRDLRAKLVAFPLFLFWKELWRFKSKSPSFLLNKNINFNKNETKTKKENLTHTFRKMNLALQLI